MNQQQTTAATRDARLAEVDPSSDRGRMLEAAKEFRASWVQFGGRLIEVRDQELYGAWGYASFDLYCRRELKLKKETYLKLTRSFAYLRDHEPEVLRTRRATELPALDVVDMLSQAKERSRVSDTDFAQIRQEVFDSEQPPPSKQQVIKRFREADPEAFRGRPGKEKPPAKGPGDRDLLKALLLAERLASILDAQADLPAEVLAGVNAAVQELRARFEETRMQLEADDAGSETLSGAA